MESLESDWDERTIIIATLIPPGSDVLEFGAGRLVLRDHLPKNCTYQPSDIVDRGENTIICDLNDTFPTLEKKYSHIIFSGVLEYIIRPEVVVGELSGRTDTVIASYATMDKLRDYVRRKKCGWMNHLTEKEFTNIFSSYNFKLVEKHSWRNQTIYIFQTQ